MDGYKRFAAICCLMALLTFKDAEAKVTTWATVTAETAVSAVSTPLVSATVADSAPGTAGVTLRDGLVSTDGTILTVVATADNNPSYDLDTPSKEIVDIVSGTGVITVKSGVTISYSATSTFTLVVTATDTDIGTLTLTVIVNAMPTFSSTPICLNIADTMATGTTLYTYAISDPEDKTVSTTIANGDGTGYFTSPIVSGNLVTAKAMAKVTDAYFVLTIEAADAGTPPSTATITVVVPVLDAGTGTGTCSGGAVVAMGSVITTLTLLIAYYL